MFGESMNIKKAEQWFKHMTEYNPRFDYVALNSKPTTEFWENMYQCFKARLKEESTLNVWPDDK